MSSNLAGVIAILMWSAMAFFVAIAGNIPPFQLIAMSCFGGAIFSACAYAARGESIIQFFKRPLHEYVFVFAGVGGYTILVFYAFHIIPAFEATVLNYLWPIIFTIFITVFHGDKLTMPKMVGMLCGFIGSILLVSNKIDTDFFHNFRLGHILAIVAAIIWALYSCLARDKKYPTTLIVPIYFVTAFICLCLHLVFEQTVMPDTAGWGAVFFLSLLRVSYLFWDYAIRQGDRSLIGSFAYFIPLLSAVIMIIGGYGPATMNVALAAALIILGCLVVNSREILNVIFKKRG